jgi:hypothetical protein
VVAEEEEEDAAVPMVVEEMQIITATATCLAPIVQEAVAVVVMREAFQHQKLPQKTRMPVMACVMRYVEDGVFFLCYAVLKVQRTKQRVGYRSE